MIDLEIFIPFVVPLVFIFVAAAIFGKAFFSYLASQYPAKFNPANNVLTGVTANEAEAVLNRYFKYYSLLSIPEKKKFIDRLLVFISLKTFKGMHGLSLTNEMKILVSASAIQLTFGLKNFIMPKFSKIMIFPESFYSVFGRAYHKGEVNLHGVIALSWKDYVEGYINPDDNYNLGLHEMAHALSLENLIGNGREYFFSHYFHKWSVYANKEITSINNEEESLLRKYAGTNIQEFFAVCVEYFFESPGAFRKSLPELYDRLSILLNQDPLSPGENIRKKKTNHSKPISPGKSFYSPSMHYYFLRTSIELGLTAIPIILVINGQMNLISSIFIFWVLLYAYSRIFGAPGYFAFPLRKFVFCENALVIKNPSPFRLKTIIVPKSQLSYLLFKVSRKDAYPDSIKIFYVEDGEMKMLNYPVFFTATARKIIKKVLINWDVGYREI